MSDNMHLAQPFSMITIGLLILRRAFKRRTSCPVRGCTHQWVQAAENCLLTEHSRRNPEHCSECICRTLLLHRLLLLMLRLAFGMNSNCACSTWWGAFEYLVTRPQRLKEDNQRILVHGKMVTKRNSWGLSLAYLKKHYEVARLCL